MIHVCKCCVDAFLLQTMLFYYINCQRKQNVRALSRDIQIAVV